MSETPNGKGLAFEEIPTELQDAARNLLAAMNDERLTTEERQEVLHGFIVTFANKDNEVSETLAALCQDATGQINGLAFDQAISELGRAWLGCLWEANQGMPFRWSNVLAALRDGRTANELFPDGLYVEHGGFRA